jgi:hypothetical protein
MTSPQLINTWHKIQSKFSKKESLKDDFLKLQPPRYGELIVYATFSCWSSKHGYPGQEKHSEKKAKHIFRNCIACMPWRFGKSANKYTISLLVATWLPYLLQGLIPKLFGDKTQAHGDPWHSGCYPISSVMAPLLVSRVSRCFSYTTQIIFWLSW